MQRKTIPTKVQRTLYAESLGYCLNPDCKEKIVTYDRDISEKAHIIEYCQSQDNSYENLIILCPNCHTRFDKNKEFTVEEITSWKKERQKELNKIIEGKFSSFEELEKQVKPLLLNNQTIYNNYYLKGNKKQWENFENVIVLNNTKIRNLINENEDLFENYENGENTNRKVVEDFKLHVEEFQRTRIDEEKIRGILYPKKFNSIFGIQEDFHESFIPSVESLECLIDVYLQNNKLKYIDLGSERPYIQLNKSGENEKILLDNIPRLKQLYYSYNCFRKTKVRFESLNFALKYLKQNEINFNFKALPNLREIIINSNDIIFVYEYCLTQEYLMREAFSKGKIIVNLHNWNGEKCISEDARELANDMGIKLLSLNEYYPYVHSIK
ncbi:HNH endonuclease [Staphylococcus simiae]|uniref:HNH endonuclease signature motif containing protein n=1 Tax=Staphylococcus simiae TaxID=308354 RepID=UPI001A973343|nr:HNH endonuclease signature motif containing protein [Staphylococcus simiae]MBO1198380.1 HNH endonuclease [Staphylococcus simiae]MBO1200574.1 HNH endonuclease [Staphylococcus simiae]MBO1202845.1 HNH endonuclease [Staphylococcus simiae]MBO1210372.1 HNH endonuclease [Staphylococcus simiae]MBO1228911.1 HNH endonuclease [Staphylococcus simiae]